MQQAARSIPQCLIATLLLLVLSAPAPADPFLEPQALPPELNQLTMQDSQTGREYVIRLDENKRPLAEDFQGDQAEIPFIIDGAIVDSASGNRLLAWTFSPRDEGNGVHILLLSGNSGNILSNLRSTVGLTKQGFRVTAFDYSGFGYSTGEASRENVLLDAESVLDHVAAQTQAAAAPLVLYGQSLGGHLAVVVAERKPEPLAAVVIEGAFSSHRDIAAERRGGLARAMVSEPYSAEQSIRELRTPLLVIHSTEDEGVPFEMGKALFDAASRPKGLLEINGPHLAGIDRFADKIAAAIMELLAAPAGES